MDEGQQFFFRIREVIQQHVANNERAGVHHRVAGDATVALQLHEAIEGRTAGLDADPFPQALMLPLVSHRQRKYFSDGLDAERLGRVAETERPSVDRGGLHAEFAGVYLRQFGNVSGYFTGVYLGEVGVDGGEELGYVHWSKG